MGIRFGAAKAISAVLTWGLRNVAHRPAANTPGKIALYADPQLIAHLRARLSCGSVVVVGTNGKTTVTNLLADVLECAGKTVVCNRTGANLDSGVATVMLQSVGAQWGVFESDELWLAKILPQLRANYVLLLNLFRDQLDRCGEIDRIQDSIVGALGSSPETVLVYNADDPLCAMIAERASGLPGRERTPSLAFGVAESMGLAQNVVNDATMCQRCSSMFEYGFRQYGQLGDYRCPCCGFARPETEFTVREVSLGTRGLSFSLQLPEEPARGGYAQARDEVRGEGGAVMPLRASVSGAYMVYNLAAVGALAHLLGCSADSVQAAIDAFDPKNGRLQSYVIEGRRVLLNLAKNPTGFNQNLKIVAQDHAPKAVAFFINDKEADGRDISWIWDVDFEELVAQRNCVVFAGGIRKNDLQVRLKYAGVEAQLVEGVEEVFAALPHASGLPSDAGVYAIANYTALPGVRTALGAMAEATPGAAPAPDAHEFERPVASAEPCASGQLAAFASAASDRPAVSGHSATLHETARSGNPAASGQPAASFAPASATLDAGGPVLTIAHMYPDLLNLYGDGGNVRVLEQRCRWRGIPVCVKRVHHGEHVDLSEVDLVFLGGGPDREQKLASQGLMTLRDDIAQFVAEGGALLAICGGYQILGNVWLLGDDEVPGLGVVDLETRRPGTSADRLIDNIVLKSPLAMHPVVGYENHAGRTYLGAGVESFGHVVSSVGHGNNDTDRADGVVYRGVVGTYAHGPVLSKNPEVADHLLAQALKRLAARTNTSVVELADLDDGCELAANAYMCKRLGV